MGVEVVETVEQLRAAVGRLRQSGSSIGFVPTMGALHLGHTSLMDAAHQQGDAVVVSIFVNPTQFAPHEDLAKYPRQREADLALCAAHHARVVFYPTPAIVYPPGFATTVSVQGLTTAFEGAVRPTHFQGVTTVVAKLFGMVDADRAYFGQKDFQQQAVIRRMAIDLNVRCEVVTCPTVRDGDGLALSSRNAYLSAADRAAGLALPRSLAAVQKLFSTGERHPAVLRSELLSVLASEPALRLDYAAIVDADTLAELHAPCLRMAALVAGKLGATRLLDNVVLGESAQIDVV